jgi:hypothetical protein
VPRVAISRVHSVPSKLLCVRYFQQLVVVGRKTTKRRCHGMRGSWSTISITSVLGGVSKDPRVQGSRFERYLMRAV